MMRYASVNLRSLQYRLVTLFLLVAVVAVPCAIHARRDQRYRACLAAVDCLSKNGLLVGVERGGQDPIAWRHLRVGSDGNLLQRGEVVNYVLSTSSQLTDEVVAAILSLATVRVLAVGDVLDDAPLGTVDAPLCKLARLRSLERLNLDSSSVTDEGVRCAAGIRSLRALDLRNTKVSGTGFGALASLRRLEELNLRDTQVGDEAASYLAAVSSLRILDLTSCRISDAALPSISALRALKSLQLHGTNVTDDGIAVLADLTSLEDLGLGWTKISGGALAHLSKMKRLKVLWLQLARRLPQVIELQYIPRRVLA